MKIKIHGARGSYPTSSKETEHYGGSTPCVEVISGTDRIILDAGTGILEVDIAKHYKQKRIDILLTHLHTDHIQGLGFFKPLFDPQKEIHIWGPIGNKDSLHRRLNRFLSPPLFPVPLRDVLCDLHIHEIENSTFEIGNFKILSQFVSHPGPTVGYRIVNKSRIFTYIPDHEPIIGAPELMDDITWLSGYDLSKDSDLLVHDAQYTVAEYKNKIGWGHSSMSHAAEFSKKTNAKHLLMFHHDPTHTDEMKNQMFEKFQKSNDYNFKIEMAFQGQEIQI